MPIAQHHQADLFPHCTFGLLRHGITVWNEEKRIQGSMDSELSSVGKKMTVKWAGTLQKQNWTRIIASDLGRAKQTVSLLNDTLRLPVTYDKRLRELHWGEWEGLQHQEINNHGTIVNERVEAGWDFRPPGGESRREGLQRARAALVDAASHWPAEAILVISHHGILKCLVFAILKLSFMPGEVISLHKDALHRIIYRHDSFTCDRLNILPDHSP